MKCIFPFLFLFFFNSAFAKLSVEERKTIDSLKYIIASAKHDSIKVKAYVSWQDIVYVSNPDLDFELNQYVVKICKTNLSKNITDQERKFYESELAYAYNNIGTYLETQGNYLRSIDFLKKSLTISKELENLNGIANAYNNMGNVYRYLGDYKNALKFYELSLQFRQKINNLNGIAVTHNNIGLIKMEHGDLAEAKFHFNLALQTFNEELDLNGQGLVYYNLAVYHTSLNEIDTAIRLFEKSLTLSRITGDQGRISSNLSKLADEYIKKAKQSINNFEFTQNINLAEELANEAIVSAKLSGSKIELINALESCYQIQKIKGNYKAALSFHEEYIEVLHYSDSLKNERQFIEQSYRYEYESKYELDSLKRTEEIKLTNAQLEKEKLQRYALYIGFLMIIVFAGFIYNRFQVSLKQKAIIHLQKEIVEEKQKEIVDSIKYAKRIQTAILPPDRQMDELLPDHFVLYLPKDIVAGDFYWIQQCDNHTLLAAADCTGHGVPGAMVSVVCNNALNRAVKEFQLTSPDEILNKTREIVISEFEKSDEEVKDGMDISLISFAYRAKNESEEKTNPNTLTYSVNWAGANNPLWILRKGTDLIEEIKADKQPIGKFANEKPFTSHTIELSKGDRFYIFTDGFQDQFGGPNSSGGGKKFKPAQLKKVILEMKDLSMSEQKQQLHHLFLNWKQNHEQVDDVCVIGVRM